MIEKIMATALTFYGQKEKPGTAHNPQIVRFFQDLGYPIADDETAWCAAFVSWVIHQHGHSFKSLRAIDFLKIGTPVKSPRFGDIVVFKNHVGFYVSHQNGRVEILGGNQRDAVNILSFSTDGVEGIRRLSGSGTQDVIKRFLADKKAGHKDFLKDDDKFTDYPITIIHEGKLIEGYLNDAHEAVSDSRYKLELIILNKDMRQFHQLVKECIAPAGCVIDWDSVHCASY